METLTEQFKTRVGAFLADTGMPAATFGMEAVGDPNLMRQIDAGRSVTLRVADEALAFIDRYGKGGPRPARSPPRRHRTRRRAPEARRPGRNRAMSERTMEQRTSASIRFLRLPEVVARTGLAASTIRERAAAGRFPRSVSLGGRARGWIEAEVDEWSRGRIAVSRGAPEGGAR